jgi:1,4-dihydroxy-2-naphthoate octaprenyltransferase
VRFGAAYARTQYLLSILIACAIPAYLYAEYRIPIFSVSAGVVALLAAPLIRIVYTQEGRVLNSVLAGTGRIMLIFAALYSIGWLL